MRVLRSAVLLWLGLAAGAWAQSTQVAFSGLQHDASLPVEVAADALEVSQADGTAVFSGNVTVAQGTLRLSAGEIRVEYGADGASQIERLIASDGVTFVNGAEAAEAQEAVYTLSQSSVVMTGDVVLTQGRNAIAGERLVIDLLAGTGSIEGRVRTIFQPAQTDR